MVVTCGNDLQRKGNECRHISSTPCIACLPVSFEIESLGTLMTSLDPHSTGLELMKAAEYFNMTDRLLHLLLFDGSRSLAPLTTLP